MAMYGYYYNECLDVTIAVAGLCRDITTIECESPTREDTAYKAGKVRERIAKMREVLDRIEVQMQECEAQAKAEAEAAAAEEQDPATGEQVETRGGE